MRLVGRRARPAPGPDDGERTRLLGLAAGGDVLALAALRADLAPGTLAALAALLLPGVGPVEVTAVLAAARAADTRREAVVLTLLVDEGLTPAAAAELLDLPVGAVQELRAGGLSRGGRPVAPHACRGWVLVARRDRLTPAEASAAQAHLDACRGCRGASAAVREVPAGVAVPAGAGPASPLPGTAVAAAR